MAHATLNSKNIITATLFFILAFISISTFAACDGVSCTGVKISRLVVTANGNVSIGTSGDESKLSCDSGRHGYIKLIQNHSNFNATYALLLSAHITEHPMWIRTGSSGECQVVYVVSDK